MTAPYVLVSSALLSGIVFAAATLPLTMMGSQPITIKVSEEPVFSGRFEELSTPYLALTTVLSLGVGAATFGLLGWQLSSRKLSHAEEQIAALRQQIQEKEALLEHLKFSETKLQTTGLNLFLEPETAVPQSTPMSPLRVQSVSAQRQPNAFPNSSISSQAESQTAAINHKLQIQPSTQDAYNLQDTSQLEGLIAHLKQVMSQIENIQLSQAQTVAQNHLH
jgi:hypothetical protein